MAGFIELRCGDTNGTHATVKVRNLGMIDCPFTHLNVATRILGLLKQLFTEEEHDIGTREYTITAQRVFQQDDFVFEVYVSLTTYRPPTSEHDPYGTFEYVNAYLLQVSARTQRAMQPQNDALPALRQESSG